MLDSALEYIEQNGMLPEEFENKDIPHFTIRLNAPSLSAVTKPSTNKEYEWTWKKERKFSTLNCKRGEQLLQVSISPCA
jgi:hypothetical protein